MSSPRWLIFKRHAIRSISSPIGAVVTCVVLIVASGFMKDSLNTQLAKVATIITLVSAVWTFISLRLSEQSIGASSTRYLNEFPYFLTNIKALITRATLSIDVFCDFPAYGCFSSPDEYIEYRQELEKILARTDIKVRLVTYGKEARKQAAELQFQNPLAEWDAYRKQNADKIRRLIGKRDCGLDSFEKDTFLELMERRDVDFLQSVRKAAKESGAADKLEIYEVTGKLPMHIWVVDGREAVFSILSADANSVLTPEYGFTTQDPSLVSALTKLISRISKDHRN